MLLVSKEPWKILGMAGKTGRVIAGGLIFDRAFRSILMAAVKQSLQRRQTQPSSSRSN
ncbi:MAG TPA: hypothetical protein VFF30_09215 [Nitrososphaerales archaeon]|nr:hypothetical protein [Nitrososphaerales archaeon]